MRALAGACTLAVVLGLSPGIAAAQDDTAVATSAQEQERANLYREGMQLASDGRWSEALERFRRVVEIRSAPKALFTLAQAEEHVGTLASAYRTYRTAASDASRLGEPDVERAASDAVRLLQPRLARVRLLLQDAPTAEATIDGRAVAIGDAVPVDPGKHSFRVGLPGVAPVTGDVSVVAGQSLDVPVYLVQSSAAPAPSGPSAAPAPVSSDAATPGSRPVLPALAIGAVAAGVVSLGLGAYFGIEAKSINDASYASGCNGNLCTPEAAQRRNDAIDAARASTIAVVAGGVLAAGGAVLWLTLPALHTHGGSVAVSAGPATGGAALVARGVW